MPSDKFYLILPEILPELFQMENKNIYRQVKENALTCLAIFLKRVGSEEIISSYE